jgi:hypothetical protein
MARVGMGPILKIGKNQKAPTIRRRPNRSNTDATFNYVGWVRAFRHTAECPADDICSIRLLPVFTPEGTRVAASGIDCWPFLTRQPVTKC